MPATKSVRIRLYCSVCALNNYYIERIEEVTRELKIPCTIERIEDDASIDARGLFRPCMYGYCPGCRFLSEEVTAREPETKCTPALEANGELLVWGHQAMQDELRQVLRPYAK